MGFVSKHRNVNLFFLVLSMILRPSVGFSQYGASGIQKKTFIRKSHTSLEGKNYKPSRFDTAVYFSPIDFSTSLTTSVDAWSVQSLDSNDLASTLFAASLFPYLAFLYFLGKEEVNTPKLANFGFKFLLFFVFATIPAGIAAKLVYNDILANVDWLHGLSESMLTLTNLFIALGFRNAMRMEGDGDKTDNMSSLKSPVLAAVMSLAMISVPNLLLAMNPEPANALSIPTWIIHVSSLIEWLASMALVWQYADFSQNPKWRGLTWGMIPLHTSGLCACTFHIFYNRPAYYSLVALQAFLTCIGNTTMALAAWRIFKETEGETVISDKNIQMQPQDFESDAIFLTKLFVYSAIGALAVKYGELLLDFPFQDENLSIALAMIFIPTAVNVGKWASRSNELEGEGVQM